MLDLKHTKDIFHTNYKINKSFKCKNLNQEIPILNSYKE